MRSVPDVQAEAFVPAVAGGLTQDERVARLLRSMGSEIPWSTAETQGLPSDPWRSLIVQ